MKWVKFGVSRHFLENPLRKWPGICMLMYLEHLLNWVDYGHSLLIFLILALFWLCEMGQIWGFGSCSLDFPHFGAPLTETGHIWVFWALSGELVGVNVEGERRHISDALRRVLSSFIFFCLYIWNTQLSKSLRNSNPFSSHPHSNKTVNIKFAVLCCLSCWGYEQQSLKKLAWLSCFTLQIYFCVVR